MSSKRIFFIIFFNRSKSKKSFWMFENNDFFFCSYVFDPYDPENGISKESDKVQQLLLICLKNTQTSKYGFQTFQNE